ncbi:MAG: type II toxin-antitoxin system Phd/YefM family antitoxin [Cyanobacteria bacterium P01_F01_bin.13]
MSIYSINEAEKNLQQLINEVIESHKPVIITNNGSNAVLLSEEDWSSIQETLYLLAIPGVRESIKEGLATPIEDCAEELIW